MIANIGLRFALTGTAGHTIHVIVRPSEGVRYDIEVVDAIGNPVGAEDLALGLEFALVSVSALRQQLYEMLGRKPTVKVEE